MIGNRFVGNGLYGGVTDERLLIGGTLVGESGASVTARLLLRITAQTLQGNSNASLAYAGLPTNVKIYPMVLSGNALALINLVPVSEIYAGALLTLSSPSNTSTERRQFGRAGHVVV